MPMPLPCPTSMLPPLLVHGSTVQFTVPQTAGALEQHSSSLHLLVSTIESPHKQQVTALMTAQLQWHITQQELLPAGAEYQLQQQCCCPASPTCKPKQLQPIYA